MRHVLGALLQPRQPRTCAPPRDAADRWAAGYGATHLAEAIGAIEPDALERLAYGTIPDAFSPVDGETDPDTAFEALPEMATVVVFMAGRGATPARIRDTLLALLALWLKLDRRPPATWSASDVAIAEAESLAEHGAPDNVCRSFGAAWDLWSAIGHDEAVQGLHGLLAALTRRRVDPEQ